MKKRKFTLKAEFGSEEVKFAIGEYLESVIPGGGIYLGLISWDKDMECWTTYSDVSTNLPITSFFHIPPENAIYIRDDKFWYPALKKIFILFKQEDSHLLGGR
jgi:hypothetical protein